MFFCLFLPQKVDGVILPQAIAMKNTPPKNITNIVSISYLKMISFYKKQEREMTDISQGLQVVPLDVIIWIGFFILLIIIILRYSQTSMLDLRKFIVPNFYFSNTKRASFQLNKGKKIQIIKPQKSIIDLVFELYALFWGQFLIKMNHNRFECWTLFLVVIMKFFMFAIFTSLISTNMVIITKPLVFDKLEDLYNPRYAKKSLLLRSGGIERDAMLEFFIFDYN